MDYDVLKEFCAKGLSITQIADTVGKSKTTVRYWLAEYKLQTRLMKEFVCACGVTGAENFHSGRKTKCKTCYNTRRLERIRDRRAYAIEKLGGCCKSCGFDKFPCSLDIHHTDPSVKDENFESMRSWSIKRIDKEIVSCVLLCKNCHSAYHSGYNIEY